MATAAGIDVSHLRAAHEEADTCILLHAVDAKIKGYEKLIIQCRDTDVLLLLLVFAPLLSPEIWMKAGTAKKPRYIKVHDIKMSNVSQFTGIGKRTAWKVFQQCPHLLHNFGEDEVPSPAILSSAEQFVCKLYDPKTTSTLIHEVHCALFRKVKANVDTLPPTQDALSLHLMRAHYQTKVWKQSIVTHPQFPSPTSCGWHMKDGMLVPQLLTKEPVQCLELTICGCRESGSQCSTRQCRCRRSGIFCNGAYGCACAAWCKNTQVLKSLLFGIIVFLVL